LTLKGKQEELHVHEVLWEDSGDLTQSATRMPVAGAADAVLQLTHAGQTIDMGPDMPVALVGRDPSSQIVIAHKTASRLHGRIERRRDKYFYIDLSTNGTYVAMSGQAEILLRHEQILLSGSGTLAVGHRADDARAEIVRFRIQ